MASTNKAPAPFPSHTSDEVAALAMQQLKAELINLTPDSSYEYMHRAQDEIVQVEKENADSERVDALRKKFTKKNHHIKQAKSPSPLIEREESLKYQQPQHATITCISSTWKVIIEELRHVGCYNITLTTSTDVSCTPALSFTPYENASSTKTIRTVMNIRGGDENEEVILTVDFPNRQIVKSEVTMTNSNAHDFIGIRVPFRDFFDDTEPITRGYTVTNKSDMKKLSCRACGACLTETKSWKVLPLPAGYWEEITEYLMCFDEVSAVHDLGTSSFSKPIYLQYVLYSVF